MKKNKNRKTKKLKVKAKKSKAKKIQPLKVFGNLQLVPPPLATEITRSFSYKLNVGNYESRDFFCSQKSYAKTGDEERVSEALYSFCKNEVIKSINQFRKADMKKIKDSAKESVELDTQNL